MRKFDSYQFMHSGKPLRHASPFNELLHYISVVAFDRCENNDRLPRTALIECQRQIGDMRFDQFDAQIFGDQMFNYIRQFVPSQAFK